MAGEEAEVGDPTLNRWTPLINHLVASLKPASCLHIVSTAEEDATAMDPGVKRAALRLTVDDELPSDGSLDLVLLDIEPNWSSVYGQLERLAESARRDSAPFPVVLVPRVGWPYNRRGGYVEASSAPADRRLPAHRCLFPDWTHPSPGEGLDEKRLHASDNHPFRNSCRTAVEDFLRTAPLEVRALLLPGFHGIAVLAPQRRISACTFLRRLYAHPGDVLLQCGHLDALERARLASDPPVAETSPLPSKVAPATHEAEIRRMASALLQLRGLVLDLLDSNRWRWGNKLGDLALLLRRQPRTETIEPALREFLNEVSEWDLHSKLTRRVPSNSPDEPRRTPAPLPECSAPNADSPFHQLVAALDSTSLAADARSALSESEARIQQVTAAPLAGSPLISVIMPTYERGHVVSEAIRSMLAQTHGNWQLLVCDDGSSDDTGERVRSFEDERIEYFSIPHSGAAVARNRALAKARGEWIAYLDSDNLWHPGFLHTMVAELQSCPAFAAAFARRLDVEIEDEHNWVRPLLPHRFDYDTLVKANSIDLNGLVHRRELYDLFGGFDENLKRQQDWDLVLKYGYVTDLLPVDAILVAYRRNRKWDQISFTEAGETPRRRVREKVREYRRGTGPAVRAASAAQVSILVQSGQRAREERASALADALSPTRSVELLSVNVVTGTDGGKLPDLRGDVIYAVGSGLAGIVRAVAQQRSAGTIVLHDVGPQTSPEPAVAGPALRVVTALSAAAVPAGSYFLQPCLGDGEDDNGDTDRSAANSTVLLYPFAGVTTPPTELITLLRRESLDTAPPGLGCGPLRGAALLLLPEAVPAIDEVTIGLLLRAFRDGIPVIAPPMSQLEALVNNGCLWGAYDPEANGLVRSVNGLLRTPASLNRVRRRANNLYRRRYSPGAVRLAFELLLCRLQHVRGE